MQIETKADLEKLPIRGFFLMSHGCFLGAIRLTSAGQLAEAYMLVRGAVERAVYAWYFSTHTEAFETWRKRNESEEARTAAKRELRISWMLKCLGETHPEVGRLTGWLYEESIDSGGHPNPDDYAGSIHVQLEGDEPEWGRSYLNPDSAAGDDCAWNTIIAGACSLSIFRLLFPDHFLRAGVTDELGRILNALADWDRKAKTRTSAGT
jgi:hypothetical protein